MTSTKKRQLLAKLKKKMLDDDTLPLKSQATNLVFGEGSANAEIMFIGEGPGYWEDQKARPFVGNAGAFLNQLLQSIELKRGNVFITNVVHYRPPGNRDPESEELEAFAKYLDRMIEIIQPKYIVTLGRFSMGKFIPNALISKIHGKPRRVNWRKMNVIVVPMYHPAAGLRSGEIRKRLFDDFYDFNKLLKNEKIKVEEEEGKTDTEQMKLV